MSISLYRKYRPQEFRSVIGQKAAVDVIVNSIAKSRIGHAYLFSGPRGCGKTSVARIFAKAVNCLNPQGQEPCGQCRNCVAITEGESLDVIEIDGASNNSVDEVRELKTHVTLAPFSSRYKIFIIDEVHMLSMAAFNALLKTLEEPPEYVIFILATTEPHKVPVTIRSRCQHIPFHSINAEDIFGRLSEVCKLENISAQDDALWEISRQADGALRDALSLLEQVISSGEVDLQHVESTFGAGSRPAFERWVKLLQSDAGAAYTGLKSIFDAGTSSTRIFEEIFSLVRNLWLVTRWPGIVGSLGVSDQEKKFLKDEAKNWEPEKLHFILRSVVKILTQARLGVRPDVLLGLFMLELETPPEPEQTLQDFKPVQATTVKRELKPEENNSSLKRTIEKKFTEDDIDIKGIKSDVGDVVPTPSADAPKIIEKNNVNYDNSNKKLKERLLNTAHGKNFVVYCALLDSNPVEQDGDLILNFEHVYCYEVLRIERNAAALSGMFTDYGNVILKHGASDFNCNETQSEKTLFDLPVEASIFSAPKGQAYEENEEESANKTRTGLKSSFENMLKELALLRVKNEILLVRHRNESNDDENENESVEEGNESES